MAGQSQRLMSIKQEMRGKEVFLTPSILLRGGLPFLGQFIKSKRCLPQPMAASSPFSHLSPLFPAVLFLTDGSTHEHFFLLLMLNMIYRLELLFIIIHFLSAVHWRWIEMPACSLIYLVKYLFQGLGHMIGVWVSFRFMHYEKQDDLTFSHQH